MKWFVYLLECCDGSFYCGATTDVERRVKQHKEGIGSKYVKSKGVNKVIWTKEFKNQSEAFRFELLVKKLPRKAKSSFVGEK